MLGELIAVLEGVADFGAMGADVFPFARSDDGAPPSIVEREACVRRGCPPGGRKGLARCVSVEGGVSGLCGSRGKNIIQYVCINLEVGESGVRRFQLPKFPIIFSPYCAYLFHIQVSYAAYVSEQMRDLLRHRMRANCRVNEE